MVFSPITNRMPVLPSVDAGQWGLYDEDGQPLITTTTFINASMTADSSIADYPIEEGGFISVHKSISPTTSRVTIATAGDINTLKNFILTAQELQRSLKKVWVITPYYTIPDLNITRFDNELKTENGLGHLILEFVMQEVRDNVATAYTTVNTEAPAPMSSDSAATQDRGMQQDTPPRDSLLYKADQAVNGDNNA